MRKLIGIVAGSVFAVTLGASSALAAGKSPAEFYKNNVVTIILGAGPGGGYDLYARTVMKHLVKHIPGKTMLLIVRKKAPKKVSKEAYAAAVAQVVGILKSKKGMARIKAAWKGYTPSSGAADFKAADVKLHKAGIM